MDKLPEIVPPALAHQRGNNATDMIDTQKPMNVLAMTHMSFLKNIGVKQNSVPIEFADIL